MDKLVKQLKVALPLLAATLLMVKYSFINNCDPINTVMYNMNIVLVKYNNKGDHTIANI